VHGFIKVIYFALHTSGLRPSTSDLEIVLLRSYL
jgi:hypothetical protein